MTKIFAVYAKVTLTSQPDWLNQFRRKYDKPYDFHLTLKQAATIEAAQLATIKKIISSVLHDTPIHEHVLKLNFNQLVFDQDDYDQAGYIYLFSKQRNRQLDDLQYAIRNQLNSFSRYLNPASFTYEHDFNPHITIARELDKSAFKEAAKELPRQLECHGEVKQIVLSCVEKITPSESTNPANVTTFNL